MSDESKKLVVEDHFELSTLHKALHEARFMHGGDIGPIDASPFIVAVANRLVDTMIAIDAEKPILGSAEGWQKWRVADQSRLEWPVCVDRARRMQLWRKWDEAKKREAAALLFAPLQLTNEKMQEFLAEVDAPAAPSMLLRAIWADGDATYLVTVSNGRADRVFEFRVEGDADGIEVVVWDKAFEQFMDNDTNTPTPIFATVLAFHRARKVGLPGGGSPRPGDSSQKVHFVNPPALMLPIRSTRRGLRAWRRARTSCSDSNALVQVGMRRRGCSRLQHLRGALRQRRRCAKGC